MITQGQYTDKWKVITLMVNSPGEIIRIDEKLPSHYIDIELISLSVIPSDQTLPEIPECGELSLLVNDRIDHIFHMSAGYSERLPDYCCKAYMSGVKLKDKRLTGYYLDEKNVVNDEQFFIPYKVKIHLRCVAYNLKASKNDK